MAPAAESTKMLSETATDKGPVIIDLGSQRRRRVRQLRRGRGKLMEEVNSVLAELRTDGSIAASAQPVVVIVRQRRRSRSVLWPLVP